MLGKSPEIMPQSPEVLPTVVGLPNGERWLLSIYETPNYYDSRNILEGLGFVIIERRDDDYYLVCPPEGWIKVDSRLLDGLILIYDKDRRRLRLVQFSADVTRPYLAVWC